MSLTREYVEGLLQNFFKHQLQIKMLHFQTKYYSVHKATDKYLVKFTENFDKFMEVAQGIVERVTLDRLIIDVKLSNDDSIDRDISKFIETLKDVQSDLEEYPELLAIRDEMASDAQQLRYLLLFE